ncbi:YndM family protein [Metabacillus malikii]|uniref:Uncharacterized BrkB/YihY/UPF0761 family membrane protein n=1 Tax=Metabacillus malikii TaxID=1504265 RepID=A0ABT9ZDH2_9BACI|nr:YndM family protein [Metabacillus malikii]MDQ0229984.1 uncharacterized BrkB/YihY/UPF0761 family membrane protein [Metabacillus malikii]
MNHLKAIMIKMAATFLLLAFILGFVFNYTFGNILTVTLLLGVISYVLGDLLLLPRTRNITATISDFALALLFTWFYLSNITPNGYRLFLVSLLVGIGVSLFEVFFHRYMKRDVITEGKSNFNVNHNLQYQTEASEELNPNVQKKNNKD